jgi:hypothetical protein
MEATPDREDKGVVVGSGVSGGVKGGAVGPRGDVWWKSKEKCRTEPK